MSYNGWKNHGTWAANLWLNNDEMTYKALNNLVRGEISEDSTEDEIISLFSNFAKNNLPENALEEIGDFSEVDWLEIGQMWIDDLEL